MMLVSADEGATGINLKTAYKEEIEMARGHYAVPVQWSLRWIDNYFVCVPPSGITLPDIE